jgi:hypothetical protein
VRRPALLLLLVVLSTAGCSLRRQAEPPPSPHCRSGDPLGGVYHPARLHVRSRCRVAVGLVERITFERFDGDVHIALRLDEPYRELLSSGNDHVGGNLVVEIIPQDRATVPIPDMGERVTVVGPWVDDTTHDWREIHPAWWISSGRIVPASAGELARVHDLLAGVENASVEDG